MGYGCSWWCCRWLYMPLSTCTLHEFRAPLHCHCLSALFASVPQTSGERLDGGSDCSFVLLFLRCFRFILCKWHFNCAPLAPLSWVQIISPECTTNTVENEGKRFKQIFELEPLLCSPPHPHPTPFTFSFCYSVFFFFFSFYLFCNCNCIQFWTQCEFVVWLWLREPLMAFYAQLWANLKRLQLLWFQLDKSFAKLSAYYKSPSPYGQSTP